MNPAFVIVLLGIVVLLGLALIITRLASERVVSRKRGNPEQSYDIVEGMETLTFNGSETDEEATVTVDTTGLGKWQDTPYVKVSAPVVRTAGSPASNSDRCIAVKVHTIDVTSGVLTFKIKAWLHTAPGGSTAADFVYLDFYYEIVGTLSDQ